MYISALIKLFSLPDPLIFLFFVMSLNGPDGSDDTSSLLVRAFLRINHGAVSNFLCIRLLWLPMYLVVSGTIPLLHRAPPPGLKASRLHLMPFPCDGPNHQVRLCGSNPSVQLQVSCRCWPSVRDAFFSGHTSEEWSERGGERWPKLGAGQLAYGIMIDVSSSPSFQIGIYLRSFTSRFSQSSSKKKTSSRRASKSCTCWESLTSSSPT